MSDGTYQGNQDRFSGFAGAYDRHRFRPPTVLAEILCRYAGTDRPALVVDLGCATGPSTRLWAGRAHRVVGIDPVEEMLETARRVTPEANVEYALGYGHATELPDDGADIVTCSQSFHWMEPVSTLAEVARILRPGGVLATYHYRWPAITGIVGLDRATQQATDRVYDLEQARGLKQNVRFYGKAGHTRSLVESAAFSFVHEFALHEVGETSAKRLVHGFETLGALQTLRKLGVGDDELGLTELRAAARTHLGTETAPLYRSYQVSLGVRPAYEVRRHPGSMTCP